ncbi:ferrous iron transport protein A [Thermodesulfovibrio aggregans]|uniref:Ferrous iron transport protein A n=1 Tax=Thermodesulfovibrio aggregans TaxID=86166 RepID=A0A0U9HWN9_9BACT|nr:FeoA family protein [Thermodesulfovibrio aggregans]GAQ94911.1 ferrous iron transport protein A [Thermodesulfovibrio aggregans]
MIPIALIQSGEKVEIVDFFIKGRGFKERIRDMGLLPTKVVEVLSNNGNGPILLKIDDSRIAIGRGMAMKIFVRRIS